MSLEEAYTLATVIIAIFTVFNTITSLIIFIISAVDATIENLKLEIKYASLNNPTPRIRVICPHTLVNNGFRWHVRAYCEENEDYRDFVLTRFHGIPCELEKSEQTSEQDENWNKKIV